MDNANLWTRRAKYVPHLGSSKHMTDPGLFSHSIAPPNCLCPRPGRTAGTVPVSTCPAHPNDLAQTAPTGARIHSMPYLRCPAVSPRRPPMRRQPLA